MTSTTYITLNLQAPNTAVTVNAKQNDRLSRYISAALYDGSVAFVPPVGASAAIRYKKPDGTGGFYDADEDANPAIIITGSTALLTLAEQCTTVPGDVYMELNFYTAAGDKLTSFTWLLKVEQSVLTDTAIVSSDYYNVLTAAIATALEYRDAAAASATAAETEAAAAAASAALALQISQQNKGWYPSAEALAAAHPTGQNGDWALVGGDIDTIWMWDSDGAAWKNTHQQTDLSNYYTKTQADAAFLGKTATASDALKLGGTEATAFAKTASLLFGAAHLLWSGSLTSTSGAITAPNIGNYTIFLCVIGGAAGSVAFGILLNGVLRITGTVFDAGGTPSSVFIGLPVSGSTVSWTSASTGVSNVTKIYGLI